ncbi:hypothetical protein [Arthrobacter mobilis]|uniref:Uncharacterized protein n=1 Tax=Arthrobacter mobilis TaxID=2724944 RepID=A0A7X6HF19_9MICC|nr:hypothetical protein [Arthrobacter mobilis]NKX55963.1 hypothetical protein [Arthrobacter mobilis]
MPAEYTSRKRALGRIADSLARHQPVRRENGPGQTCRNQACNRVIFLNRQDIYNHQAVVLANDLQADLDFMLETALEDAAGSGAEPGHELLAEIRAEYLVLAPAPAPASS